MNKKHQKRLKNSLKWCFFAIGGDGGNTYATIYSVFDSVKIAIYCVFLFVVRFQ